MTQKVPAAATATILLVEDNASVLLVASRYLADAGHMVFAAKDGAEAEALAASYAGSIDVLVTDDRLPGIRGMELAARLKATRPGIKVIYLTGDPFTLLDDLGEHHENAVLGKPFKGKDLERAVQLSLGLGRG